MSTSQALNTPRTDDDDALSMCVRRLLLVGPPGAGKTSQGGRLAERLGSRHLSTGNLLRDEVRRGSPAGRQAQRYVDAGALVPDWLVLYLLEHQLAGAFEVGFVLDGYPRTLEQAQRLKRSLGTDSLDLVIELVVSDDVAEERLADRTVCDRCAYPSSDASTLRCSRCNQVLTRRDDDVADVVCKRLRTYRERATPMLAFFADMGIVVSVNGDRPQGEVAAALFHAAARVPTSYATVPNRGRDQRLQSEATL
jgi:adenylate kinase